MKRKIAIAMLSAAIACCSAVGLAACVTDSGDTGEPFWTIETAYAEAQDLGYGGTLEEFLAQIQGEDGKDGQDGIGIADIFVDENGMLYVTLSDGGQIECGNVRGEQGAPGVGITGAEIDIDGNLILYLSTGEPINCGKVVGSNGQDGLGILNAYVDETGQLTIEYTDGSIANVGAVVGEPGQDGQNGQDGQDGVGIQDINIVNDRLVITLTNNTRLNLGNIKGDDGEDGKDGDSISGAFINENGELVLNFTSGNNINVGNVVGSDGTDISNITIDENNNLIIYLSNGGYFNLGNIKGQDGADGADGVGIQNIAINEFGELVITLTNNNVLNLGNVMGANGQDGADGIGIHHIDIVNGNLIVTLTNNVQFDLGNIMGTDGTNGEDGDSVSSAYINENGELVLTFVSGKQITVGNVVGADGQNGADGKDGQDGKDGVGVQNVVINENGELVITLTNQTELNLGNVTGADGNDGKDGASVTAAHIDSNGHLILTFNDEHTLDCGNVMGTDGVGIGDIAFNESGELIITMTDDSIINCGKIPVCVHQYSVWNTILEPTCTSIGYETRTCSICNNVEYNFFEKLDHTYGEWQDMIDTCTEHWQTRSCQICGDSQVREAEPAGHIFINGFCVVCGEVDIDSIDLTYLDQFNGTYGYEFLGTLTNGEALQTLYETIDDEVKKFHVNTAIDAPDDYILADIDIGTLGLSTDQALSVWKTYKDDNPLYYWLSNTVTYSGESITLLIEEDYANGKVRSYYNQLIEDQVDAYSSMLYEGANEYDIALAYHDAILTAVDYSYDESNQPEDSAWAHNIIGVFNGQGAVCEGYARTYQLLLNYSGIENIFVTGDGSGEEHAWNLVKMDDGNWYWCDLTWDDTFVGGLNTNWKWGISYNYFLVNDTQNTLIEEGGWQYGSEVAFLENHTYDTSTGSGIDFLYDLPERAEGTYSSDNIMLLDEISVDTMVLQVVGYNALELHEVTGEGHFDIPSTVNYSGRQFTIISAGGGDILSGICQGNITSVTIPDSIVFIWDHAFRTYSLQNIYVAEDSPKFTSKDGVLFTKSLYTLIQYPSANERTEYIIPDETNILAYLSFDNCQNLSKLTIGKNMNTIGMTNWGGGYRDGEADGWFGGNVVNGGIERICNALAEEKQIIVHPENTSYQSDDFAIYNYGKTSILYVYDKDITTYHIPNTVTYIESTSTSSTVFSDCKLLESFSVDDSHPIFSVCDGVLYNKQLTEIIDVPAALSGDITIPEGVTHISRPDTNGTIGKGFSGCKNLTSVTLPETLTVIGNSAFSGCTNLRKINIPDTVIIIGKHAFFGCSSLESITIPNGMTSIGNYAFNGCSSLTSITIPDSVTSVGDSAFDGCSNLTSITLPESVTIINPWTFSRCNSLTSITIPNSVTIISDSVFSGCTSLTSITIPNSVTSIGDSAFRNCSSLTSITIPDSVTSIGDSAFYGCSSLTSIAIPNGVTSIGNYAFNGCSSLTSIAIPNGVTSIGNYAFNGCSSLTNITIPNSVTIIGDSAFYGCSSLTSITIPDSVTIIGDNKYRQ